MDKKVRIMLIVICLILIIFLVSILVWGIRMKDFNFSKSYEVVKEETYSVDEIKEIEVLSRSADIVVYKTTDNNIKVVQKSSSKNTKRLFESSSSNGILKIDGRESTKNFCIGFCFWDVVLEIYIPSIYENDIKIETASGDITIELENLSKLKANTASGDIELKRSLIAEEVDLKSISGDIETVIIQASNISIESTSGDIESTRLEENIYLKTISGKIECDNIKGEATISTVSGDIDIDYFNIIGNSKITSTSGDIEISLSNDSSVRMSGNSVSGDIRFPNSESIINDGIYSLYLKTISGDIDIRIAR